MGTKIRLRDPQQTTPQRPTGSSAQAKGYKGGIIYAGHGGRSRHMAWVAETIGRGW